MKLSGSLALLAIALPMAIASPVLVVPRGLSQEESVADYYGTTATPLKKDPKFIKKTKDLDGMFMHNVGMHTMSDSKIVDKTHTVMDSDTLDVLAKECSNKVDKKKWDKKKKSICENYMQHKVKSKQDVKKDKDDLKKDTVKKTDELSLMVTDSEKDLVKKGGKKKKVKDDMKMFTLKDEKNFDLDDTKHTVTKLDKMDHVDKDTEIFKKNKSLVVKKGKKGKKTMLEKGTVPVTKKSKEALELNGGAADFMGGRSGLFGTGNEISQDLDAESAEIESCDEECTCYPSSSFLGEVND